MPQGEARLRRQGRPLREEHAMQRLSRGAQLRARRLLQRRHQPGLRMLQLRRQATRACQRLQHGCQLAWAVRFPATHILSTVACASAARLASLCPVGSENQWSKGQRRAAALEGLLLAPGLLLLGRGLRPGPTAAEGAPAGRMQRALRPAAGGCQRSQRQLSRLRQHLRRTLALSHAFGTAPYWRQLLLSRAPIASS